MTAYTTYVFYETTYLQGRQAVLSTADFPYFAMKATHIIKQYTNGTIDQNKPIDEVVQYCTCELAEYLFNQVSSQQNEASVKSLSGITSEKVGEYSVSYASAQTIEATKTSAIEGIIKTWLSGTIYLYLGVYHVHKC